MICSALSHLREWVSSQGMASDELNEGSDIDCRCWSRFVKNPTVLSAFVLATFVTASLLSSVATRGQQSGPEAPVVVQPDYERAPDEPREPRLGLP